MFRMTRWIAAFAGVAIFLALTGSPALAIFPQLQTALSGPAIDGLVPGGDAKLDQSGLPYSPGQLWVKVENVNLPDGTSLDVILGRVKVGTITLASKKGSLFATFWFQVGRLDPILITLTNGTDTLLVGGAPWKVSADPLGSEPPEEEGF